MLGFLGRRRMPPPAIQPTLQPLDEFLLATEYSAVRQEILHGIELQQRALQFGFGAVALAITLAFQDGTSADLRASLCFVFSPAICFLTLFIWFGELCRGLRASYYLGILEIKNPISNRWVFRYNRWIRFGEGDEQGLGHVAHSIQIAYAATLALLLALPLLTGLLGADSLVLVSVIDLPAWTLPAWFGMYLFVASISGLYVVVQTRRFTRFAKQ